MTQMIRKQIYIQKQQQLRLKKLSQLRGTSEAAVIRQAIDQELRRGNNKPYPDPQAWEDAYQFMRELHAQGPLESEPRRWTRDDLYQERMSRYERHTN
jgi:hypothetical protein